MTEHLNHVTQPPTDQIRRFLDLSTGHLQASDRLFLKFSADPCKGYGVAAMAGRMAGSSTHMTIGAARASRPCSARFTKEPGP